MRLANLSRLPALSCSPAGGRGWCDGLESRADQLLGAGDELGGPLAGDARLLLEILAHRAHLALEPSPVRLHRALDARSGAGAARARTGCGCGAPRARSDCGRWSRDARSGRSHARPRRGSGTWCSGRARWRPGSPGPAGWRRPARGTRARRSAGPGRPGRPAWCSSWSSDGWWCGRCGCSAGSWRAGSYSGALVVRGLVLRARVAREPVLRLALEVEVVLAAVFFVAVARLGAALRRAGALRAAVGGLLSAAGVAALELSLVVAMWFTCSRLKSVHAFDEVYRTHVCNPGAVDRYRSVRPGHNCPSQLCLPAKGRRKLLFRLGCSDLRAAREHSFVQARARARGARPGSAVPLARQRHGAAPRRPPA